MFTDKYAVERFRQIVEQFGIKTVIETGTYVADSTVRFAEFVDQVFSIELNENFLYRAQVRLIYEGYIPEKLFPFGTLKIMFRTLLGWMVTEGRIPDRHLILAALRYIPYRIVKGKPRVYSYRKGTKKITLFWGNSPQIISQIIEEIPHPICFYLDAHWHEYWPVNDEIRAIKTRPSSVVIIHDFKVPGKPFGYDTYGGVNLDYELVKDALAFVNPDYKIFYNDQAEGKHSRGILYATP